MRIWKTKHAATLDRLLEHIGAFISERSSLSFEELLSDFESNDFRVQVGVNRFAHILYGPKPLFLTDDGELNMDIKGLVYRPRARLCKGKLIVDFGGAG